MYLHKWEEYSFVGTAIIIAISIVLLPCFLIDNLIPSHFFFPDTLAGEDALLGSLLSHSSNTGLRPACTPPSGSASCLDEFAPTSHGVSQPLAGKEPPPVPHYLH